MAHTRSAINIIISLSDYRNDYTPDHMQ